MRQKDLVLAVALAFALLAPTPTHAALKLVGIDGISSTVLQQDQSSFSGLGLRARVHSDAFVPQFVFMPTVEYWRSRSKLEPYAIRAARKDATLGLDARWEFTTGAAHPYLGAGYGIHFLASEMSSTPLAISDSHSSMRGGLALLGGFSFPLGGRLSNFVEAKYHHLSGERQVKLNWGLSYDW
jgi:hypothetical protein